MNVSEGLDGKNGTKEKKKVLLSFVGGRDPYNVPQPKSIPIGRKKTFGERFSCLFSRCSCDIGKEPLPRSEGSLLTLCKAIHPDIVYLFPSNGGKNSTLKNAEETKSILDCDYERETTNLVEQILSMENEQDIIDELRSRIDGWEELEDSISRMLRYNDKSQRIGELKNLLRKFECTVLPLDAPDPTDFEVLSREFRKNLSEVASRLGDFKEYSFHINCSSGTQQMAALAYVFADSGMFPGIQRWQCKDPHFLEKGESRTRNIDTPFLQEHVIVGRIKNNLKACSFLPITSDCEELSKIPDRRETALFLQKVFTAYFHLDILCYNEALRALEDLESLPRRFLENAERIKKTIESQISFLRTIDKQQNQDSGETPEILTDLFFNMERCIRRGGFADALSRFWRIGEGVVFFRLVNIYGINRSNYTESGNTRNLLILEDAKANGRLRLSAEGNRIDYAPGRYLLSTVFKDREYTTFWNSYNDSRRRNQPKENRIHQLIEVRNKHIHGGGPVTREDAECALEIARKMILALVPNTETLCEEFPFKAEKLRIVAALVAPDEERAGEQ